MDGHRTCRMSMEPQQTKAAGGICNKCGKKVTIGVMHRVDDLANRGAGFRPERARPFRSIIPLPEILSEIENVGVQSKRVEQVYHKLLDELGNEFSILLDVPIEDIARAGSPSLAEAIKKMRAGEVSVQGGYDGEYGIIKVFDEERQQRSIASENAKKVQMLLI